MSVAPDLFTGLRSEEGGNYPIGLFQKELCGYTGCLHFGVL